MADYFTQVSFEVELPDEQAVQKAIELFAEIAKRIEDPEGADWTGDFAQFKPYEWSSDIVIEAEGCRLWIRDDCGGPNMELLADYLQLVLKRYHPTGCVGFEFANTCSKARLDSFSGGCVFVTAEDQKWMTTWEWLSQQRDSWVADQASVASGQG